jgi:hypothetical protein
MLMALTAQKARDDPLALRHHAQKPPRSRLVRGPERTANEYFPKEREAALRKARDAQLMRPAHDEPK